MLCVCELVTCELLAVEMKRRKEDKRQDDYFTQSVMFFGFAVIVLFFSPLVGLVMHIHTRPHGHAWCSCR